MCFFSVPIMSGKVYLKDIKLKVDACHMRQQIITQH